MTAEALPGRSNVVADSEPKLRHEFVGMMFAVTIAEVGLQTASLVRLGHWIHYLPAYSHLLLATITIAASWVGWTLSSSPGARHDVRSVLQPEFLILLLDVALVISYFILTRSVELVGEAQAQPASASPEAFWIFAIFLLYFVWDVLTKVIIYINHKKEEPWLSTHGVRILPTILCICIAFWIMGRVEGLDAAHVIPADLALIGLVLLFRALKELVSALAAGKETLDRKKRIAKGLLLTIIFGAVVWIGIAWAQKWPIPKYIAERVNSPVEEPATKTVPVPANHKEPETPHR